MFNQFFTEAVAASGLPEDQLRYIICILLTYPIALIFRYFVPNNSNIKHLFSIVTTLFLFIFVHDQWYGLLHLTLSCLVTYSTLYFIKSGLGPKLVFVWAMLHMSYTHINRMIYDYGLAKMDYSGPQMVWTIKLTMFAYNVYDGRANIKSLSPYQLSKRVEKLPTLLEFLGYILYFGGFFVGPAFDYSDYTKFINLEAFKVNNGDDKGKEKVVIPNTIIPSVKKLIGALICALVPVFVAPKINGSLLLTASFINYTWITKIFYVILVGTAERFKYYFVWQLSEGACILSGLGYRGLDASGNHQWDGVTNVRLLKVELAENFRMIMENWNIGTNLWLRNYVYLRLTPVGQKPTFSAQLMTFVTSAFWHGFYPGYYFTFIFGGLVNELARIIRRQIRPHILNTNSRLVKFAYDIIGFVFTSIAINYTVIPFIFLTPSTILEIHWKLYFFGHIAVILGFAFFNLGGHKFILPKLPTELKRAKSVHIITPTSLNPLPPADVPAPLLTPNGSVQKKLA